MQASAHAPARADNFIFAIVISHYYSSSIQMQTFNRRNEQMCVLTSYVFQNFEAIYDKNKLFNILQANGTDDKVLDGWSDDLSWFK